MNHSEIIEKIKTRRDGDLLNLSWANLSTANLFRANLFAADLSGVDLSNIRIINTIGNGKEIKSAQFDNYNVVWTADTLAIGCQQHPISKWQKADPRWIAAMAADATEWWTKHGEFVLKMIEHSPATGKIIAD